MAGINHRFVFQGGTQISQMRFVCQADGLRPNSIGLFSQKSRVRVRREADDFHSVGNVVRDFDRALADRASGSEHDDAFAFHLCEGAPFKAPARRGGDRKITAAR